MNTVHLSGLVRQVKLTDFKTWIAASIKLELSDTLTTWVDVKGIQVSSKEVESLPNLEGKQVVIEGYLSSREAKATEDKPARTFYAVAAGARHIIVVPEQLTGEVQNSCLLSGKVEEVKEAAGAHWAKVGIKYYIPPKQEFGTRWVRVKCNGTVPEAGKYIVVQGVIEDAKGALVNATSICNRQFLD